MSGLPSMTLSQTATDFIDDARLHALLAQPAPEPGRVREVIAKSLDKQSLSVAG